MSFLSKHNSPSEIQYGFRERHSTYMAWLNIIDQISQEMDNKKFSVSIFLHLSKAFYTIDHGILMRKLEIYGIRGNALRWLSSYLSNRTKCVCIGDILCKPGKIVCGVPQGSVLGPLLFILYINDLVNVATIFKLIMFVDDTNAFASHKNFDQLISIVQSELNKVVTWLKINKLSLNAKKTHFIIFHNRKKN